MSLIVTHTKLFYELAGWRLIGFVALTLVGGITDGIGLALVVPVLEIGIGANSTSSPISEYVRQAFGVFGLTPTLPWLLLSLVVVFSLKGIFTFLAEITVAFMQISIQERLRLEFTSQVVSARLPYVLRTKVGTLSNLFTTELDGTVQNVRALTTLAGAVILFGIYVSAALAADWRTGVVAVVVAGLVLGIFVSINRKTRVVSHEVSNRNAKIQDLVLQAFNNIKFLKATHSYGRLIDHLGQAIGERRGFHKVRQSLKAIVTSAMEPFAILVIAAFILYSISVRGESLGAALLPLLFLYRSVGRAGEIQKAWHSFLATSGPVTAFNAARVELANERENFPDTPCPPLKKTISMADVSYSYDNSEDALVLKNVTLDMAANTVIGITGQTGAGKTTVVDLLCGLLPAQSGSVSWDEFNYDALDLTTLRARIGYVTQDPVVFNDTIANNITLWDDQGDDEFRQARLREAAKAAHCLEFIEATEDRFETQVGERSYRMSGGQRQRLAIARELYRDPEILIFDEGTSSLDAETEAAIQATLDSLRARKTVIIIAHRLSTLRRCDQIFVLDGGQLIESGNWDDLTTRPEGWLARAAKLQQAI